MLRFYEMMSYESDDQTITPEATEKQRKMKTDTRLDTLHDIHSRGTLTPQTKVVTSHPNTKFTDVKQITKNPRHHEQNMTKQNSRT